MYVFTCVHSIEVHMYTYEYTFYVYIYIMYAGITVS